MPPPARNAGPARIVIDDVRPRTPAGNFPAKATVGEAVPVSADIFADGHDVLAARSRTRVQGSRTWTETPLTDQGDDRFGGVVHFDAVGPHELVIDAWIDRHATWRHDVRAKVGAGQDVATELEEGSRLLDAL
ncbi:MAG: DUF3416 domain-containing protein, partial [Actinomycetota bacterium]|nr:DUF3416 domain-containing protein [Actinomycetota bacterium]